MDDLRHEIRARACWVDDRPADGGRVARLVAVAVADGAGRPTLSVRLGEELTLQVLYQSLDGRPIHLAVALKNRYDQLIFSGGSYTQQLHPPSLRPGEYALFEMTITCTIEAGQYTFRVSLASAGDAPNRGTKLDETPWLGPLVVAFDYEAGAAPFLGMFGLPVLARFKSADEPP
jgi:lipopolysaccharide transport system ATP-binding protein